MFKLLSGFLLRFVFFKAFTSLYNIVLFFVGFVHGFAYVPDVGFPYERNASKHLWKEKAG